MLICTARGLFSTVAAMIAPCSVNASGKYLMFWPRFNITECDLERCASIASSLVSLSAKSGGKRSAFRFTAWFSVRVSTP